MCVLMLVTTQEKCVKERDFEGLEMYVMNLLMGIK